MAKLNILVMLINLYVQVQGMVTVFNLKIWQKIKVKSWDN